MIPSNVVGRIVRAIFRTMAHNMDALGVYLWKALLTLGLELICARIHMHPWCFT